jgi:hypothetical protein
MAERGDPEAASATMREAQLEPLEPFEDADKPWRCRCTVCRRVVTPRLSNVRIGLGCLHCATRGIDLQAPAVVHVSTNRALDVHLVGIDSSSGERRDQLVEHGWEIFRGASLPTGEEAYEVQCAALRRLRLERGLPPQPTAAGLPAGAGVQTVRASDVEPAEIWAVVSDELSRRRRRRRARGSQQS